ncbi:MAG: PhoD-like phosphatase N-terminal domain-containing protein, partial [Phenylobacterium sp.]
MTALDRRRFLGVATALGATAAWGGGRAAPSMLKWTERRDLFPEGVASGDPQSDSVILWTRRPPGSSEQAQARLVVEVAEDETFQRVVANAPAIPSAENGWTVRV